MRARPTLIFINMECYYYWHFPKQVFIVVVFCHRLITLLLIYFRCYSSSATYIQINKEKLSLKCLTKRILDLLRVVFAWTMHRYGSHEHSLYFTELEWNRSNTTLLWSGTFFGRIYLFGYIVSNSLKNNLRSCRDNTDFNARGKTNSKLSVTLTSAFEFQL